MITQLKADLTSFDTDLISYINANLPWSII